MRVVRRLTHADIQAMRGGPPTEDDPYLNDAPWDGLPYRRVFEEHDRQTQALIRQYQALSRFPHSETVIDRLEHWRWLDAMAGPDDKQAYLEPLIAAVHRDPIAHEDMLVFLLIVCEPVRRGVSKEFIKVRGGLEGAHEQLGPTSWHRREEARRLHEVERQTLFDVTRAALLDALYRYPTPPPNAFFPWLRATIAHGALDHIRRELPELETTPRTAAEAEAVQEALCGLQELGAPELREAPNRKQWRCRIEMRSVFEIAERVASSGQRNRASIFSAGVRHWSVCLGRLLRSAAIWSSSSWLRVARSSLRGRYWRSSPLVFSFEPRCHGERGSQK